ATTSSSRTAYASRCSVSRSTTETTARTDRWRTTWRGPATTWGRSPSPPGGARRTWPRATRRTGTTTARSWSRRSPTASPKPSPVAGLYFAHPEARYFTVGKVGRDQVEDYARRKGVTLAEAERWLRPNLGYEPPPSP